MRSDSRPIKTNLDPFGPILVHSCIRMAAVTLRKRAGREEIEINDITYTNHQEEGKFLQKKASGLISMRELCFLLTCLASLIALAALPHKALPRPKKEKGSKESEFIAERARSYLSGITRIGPRPIGSYENDIATVDYILKEIGTIISHAHEQYQIDVELQTATGGFMLHFLDIHFAVAYENITNVIVHVYPKRMTNLLANVLVNCHFDSQPRTEGASDDAVSCAIMLESMRAITKSPPDTIKQGIVFLFNGAEEGFLMGSHAFVLKHKLSSTIKAFVNLEAAGSGGKEIVFQTGPGHPWLIQTYASHAAYPYASIVGQEIFQSGLIPSDTDFRVFRDYGGMVGIDIAYASNGYVYHTSHDTASIIPDGSMQRGGENFLAIILALSNSPYLIHKEEYKQGKVVFFDLFGWYMVIFPQAMETWLNYGCVLAAVLYIIMQLQGTAPFIYEKTKNTLARPTILSLVVAVTSIVISWISALLTAVLEALVITKFGRSLSWFSHPWFALMLYGMPAFSAILFVHHVARYTTKKSCIQHDADGIERRIYENSCFLAHLLIISILVAFMTYKGIMSTFLLTTYVLFPLLSHCFIGQIMFNAKDELYSSRLVLVHVSAVAFPIVLVSYHLHSIFDVFIPIMGRQGTEIPPDVVFAVISTFCIIMASLYVVSIIHAVKEALLIIKLLAVLSVFAFLLAVSGLMFPYSGDHPVAPKRILMQHVSRNFHNKDGMVYKNDSGMWFGPLDYLGLAPMMHLPSLKNVSEAEFDGPYHGYPYILPINQLLKKTWYLKGSPPFADNRKHVVLKELKQENLSELIVRRHFRIMGPDHITLLVTPNKGNKLVKWSITDELPIGQQDYDGRMTYFTFYAHGFYSKPWDFWVDFEVNAEAPDGSICDITAAGHFVHGPLSMTKWMQSILAEFPSWIVDISFVSTYDVWRV